MRTNRVKALWQEGKIPTVAWLSSADTYVAEVMANAGFDALVLDTQHGMAIGPDRVALWLQTVCTTDTMPVVRIPWNEPFFAQWALDAGAMGIIVPLVNSREEAVKAGGACRYPPDGFRSSGANRARFYGADYVAMANAEIICLVMIEDINTVPKLHEIATAPGIDGFYIGPTDLALTMGLKPTAYRESSEHAAECKKILEAGKSHGLFVGVHCFSPEEVVQRTAEGFMFCPCISDIGALTAAARDALREVKGQ